MIDVEGARRWILEKHGDGTRETKHEFAEASLPPELSIAAVNIAMSGLTEDGSVAKGSGVISLDNAGYLLRVIPKARAR
jgi:hypothetical protein